MCKISPPAQKARDPNGDLSITTLHSGDLSQNDKALEIDSIMDKSSAFRAFGRSSVRMRAPPKESTDMYGESHGIGGLFGE